jgi:hypothetical protein
VIDALVYATIAVCLAYAVWAGIVAAVDRAPGRALFAGAAVVGALVLVQGVVAVAALFEGNGIDTGLFVGYLLTAVLLMPAAVVLARMEPTRWGSAILAAGGLVLAPLLLRVIQIWTHGG